MTEVTLLPKRHMLRVTWPDGTAGTYPYIWLRDNCPSAYHPATQERTLDLIGIPPDIAPARVALESGSLTIAWDGTGHESRFPLDWLAAHRVGRQLADPAQVYPRLWRADIAAQGVPRAAAEALKSDDTALGLWLSQTCATGLSIVEGLADDCEAGMEVARRVGFLRETNFGRIFDVISKPDPNNLAYTAEALPLHTDLPNQELPPGVQFLHCIANQAAGGESLFADGFALAEDLRRQDLKAFDLLAGVAIPFRFRDVECDIRYRHPVIGLNRQGECEEIRWNAHIAGVFDMEPEILTAYYDAYRRFMAMTRDPAYRVELKLRPGEMVVFDNRRVLHGRTAFHPASGHRHLRGCYVDRGEMLSRLRVLARGLGSG